MGTLSELARCRSGRRPQKSKSPGFNIRAGGIIGPYFWYSKQGSISRSVRNALEKAIELKHELIRLERSLAHLEKQLAAIQEGQKRLRDNIATVGRESQLGKRYLAKLSDDEDQIESFERQIAQTRQMAEDKRGELAEYLKSLDVD